MQTLLPYIEVDTSMETLLRREAIELAPEKKPAPAPVSEAEAEEPPPSQGANPWLYATIFLAVVAVVLAIIAFT